MVDMIASLSILLLCKILAFVYLRHFDELTKRLFVFVVECFLNGDTRANV